jgi:hypothetical protein
MFFSRFCLAVLEIIRTFALKKNSFYDEEKIFCNAGWGSGGSGSKCTEE